MQHADTESARARERERYQLQAAVALAAQLRLDVNGARLPAVLVPAVAARILELVLDLVVVTRGHAQGGVVLTRRDAHEQTPCVREEEVRGSGGRRKRAGRRRGRGRGLVRV